MRTEIEKTTGTSPPKPGGAPATGIDKAVPVAGDKSAIPLHLLPQKHHKGKGATDELDDIVSAIQGMMRAFKLAGMGVLRFMDVPMPNGKTMGNCTGGYGRDIGQWMQDIGRKGDDTVITADTLRAIFDERPELLIRYRDLARRAA